MAIEGKDIAALFKRKPIPATSALLVVVLLLFAYFRMGVVESRQLELEAADKTLSKLINNITYSAQLDQHLFALREVNLSFAEKSLKVGQVARNQQFFYELESRAGVRISELRPLPIPLLAKGVKAGFFQPLGFSLTIKGEYKNLLKYLRNLEYAQIPGRLVTASFVYTDQEEQTLDINIEVLGMR